MASSPTKSSSSLQIDPSAHIADKASLNSSSSAPHPLIIGPSCVIHPFARLDSSAGPIMLGDRCVVWEKASLGGISRNIGDGKTSRPTSMSADGDATQEKIRTITIAEGGTVHPHARIVGPATVGARCSVGVGAVLEAGVVLGEGVTVASGVRVPEGLVVEKDCTVYGDGGLMRRPGRGATEGVRRDLMRAKTLQEQGEEKLMGLTVQLIKGSAGGAKFVG